jgi:hypothetical protein
MTPNVIKPKQIDVVTTIADPGSDEKIPTEQAVRELVGEGGGAANSPGVKVYLWQNFI